MPSPPSVNARDWRGRLQLLVVQPTPFCNLDCSYCYLPNRGNKQLMAPVTLEALATGQTCLAFDYSGDVTQAAARATEARQGVTVRFVAPKEGVQVGFDMLAIPADAAHKAEAHAFIDFVLRPAIMARITAATHYPNAVPASQALLKDTSMFPTEAERARFFTIGPVPQAAERTRTRLWARFKAGN